jgi:hypothetical protein
VSRGRKKQGNKGERKMKGKEKGQLTLYTSLYFFQTKKPMRHHTSWLKV